MNAIVVEVGPAVVGTVLFYLGSVNLIEGWSYKDDVDLTFASAMFALAAGVFSLA